MDLHLFLIAAAALAVERITYIWISRQPHAFERLLKGTPLVCAVSPIDAVRWLFIGFKLLQGAVLLRWLITHAEGSYVLRSPAAAVFGVLLVAFGQQLNIAVFRRLGADGVFFGRWFGKPLQWTTEFPFSFVAHPQYLGASLSIWGLFLLMRYPYPDWLALPMLESAYYAVAARLER